MTLSCGLHLGHGQRLELRQELKMTQAQKLGQKLEQSLRVMQTQRLGLRLYIERESLLKRLYLRAIKNDDICHYEKNGMSFDYAIVCIKDLPEELVQWHSAAFSHCLYDPFEAMFCGTQYALARGEWFLFVIEDMIPGSRKWQEYWAVHERGEQVTLGRHDLATKLEFAVSDLEGQVKQYIAWLETDYPDKFWDVYNYKQYLVLPDDDEFIRVLQTFASSNEAVAVKQLIAEFDWPLPLLKTLSKYRQYADRLHKYMEEILMLVMPLIPETMSSLPKLLADIKGIVRKSLRSYLEYGGLPPCISPSMVAEWHETRRTIDQEFLTLIAIKEKAGIPGYTLEDRMAVGLNSAELPNEGILSRDLLTVFNTAGSLSS